MAIPVFEGQEIVELYYRRMSQDIRSRVDQLTPEVMQEKTDEALAAELLAGRRLEPLEEDPERSTSSVLEQDVSQASQTPMHDANVYVTVEFPLARRESNAVAVTLKGSHWLLSSGTYPFHGSVQFRPKDHVIFFRSAAQQVGPKLATIRQLMGNLNTDISRLTPVFERGVLQNIVNRRQHLSAQIADYERRVHEIEKSMAQMGITLKKKPDAVEPIEVKIKQPIRVLRAPSPKPQSPAEPHLTQQTTDQIVGLIDRAGQGFETAPSVYQKLGEEDLRTIILDDLNAVFDTRAATGETFSVRGKTDIYLNAPGGAVLIAECKYWGGARLYSQTIDQLFGYLAWRHTVGVMITFSRNKSLTKVVVEAEDAIKAHPSFRSGFAKPGSTHLVSEHAHPADAEKQIQVHHLFFNLYAGQ